MPRIETNEIIHILRNPYGWSKQEKKKAYLAAADEIERWKDAFENMCTFAKDNDLDITTYN